MSVVQCYRHRFILDDSDIQYIYRIEYIHIPDLLPFLCLRQQHNNSRAARLVHCVEGDAAQDQDASQIELPWRQQHTKGGE
jgi:hypothetical protein